MARILFTVSSNVSPFDTELEDAVKFKTSADNLLSANSKDILVLVEFSKKRFTMVTSRNEGTFFIGLLITSLKSVAALKMR
jgi:hypothetical protein